MNRFAAFVLPLACVVFLTTCKSESNHDQEIAEKIKQLEAIRDKPLRAEERDKKMNQFARELNRTYPSALPIGKDSAERIIQNPLPDTIDIYQKIDRLTEFQKPVGKFLFDSLVSYPQKEYFAGIGSYGIRKGKKFVPQRGFFTMVKDMGYMAEWFSMLMANQVLTGKGQAGYDLLMRNHRFEKTIEYMGQKWAVWYEPTYTRPRYHTGSRVFITYWNHRFAVFAVTSDTTQHAPDFASKILDEEWLDQLKYPTP